MYCPINLYSYRAQAIHSLSPVVMYLHVASDQVTDAGEFTEKILTSFSPTIAQSYS
jgi:hypothetical protein